jgi:hypothetical protein
MDEQDVLVLQELLAYLRREEGRIAEMLDRYRAMRRRPLSDELAC